MTRLAKSNAAGPVLAVLLLLVTTSTTLAKKDDPPKKPDKPKSDIPEFMLPADMKKAAASIKSLADRMIPSSEALKANGQWKPPWEFPAGLRLSLPYDIEEFYGASLYRVPQDLYWEGRAQQAGFVGLSSEEAEKRVADLLKDAKAEARDLTDRQACLAIILTSMLFHPATPTLAATQEANADWQTKVVKSSGDPDKLLKVLEFPDRMQKTFMMLDASYDGVPDTKLKERVADILSLSQQWTRFVLCRATEWDGVMRIGDAQKDIEDIIRKNQPEWANTKGPLTQVIVSEKTLQDPGWAPAQRRLKDAFGDSGSPDGYMKKNDIRFSTAVVNVRKLSPDAINGDLKERVVKDLTEADAKRVEDKANASYKAIIELVRPKTEKELEGIRKGIQEAQDAGNKSEAQQRRETLDKKEKAWKDQQAQTYKVQKRPDIGVDDCYVISTRYISAERDTAILHMASLRFGVYLVEVEIMSTMSEDEAQKDLEFFLKHLEQRMTAGRGPVSRASGEKR